MNQVVLTLLCALLFGVSLTHSAGHGAGRSPRCLCRGRLLKSVNPGIIHVVELFPPSASCSKTEIILTLTRKGKGKGKGKEERLKVCLHPYKKQGRRLVEGNGIQNKKQKNGGRKGKN
ncbi:chemokine (C-X-C motif) ligand 20 [Pimephales promelas]|uniref:chemokine (C-X-C motif) ligand 20 n=1 Tax=Pimephales promelas TaxID=90988 RepID=UPI001955BC89|nr:chemokine (C-X-C motif) ligand 20 [Pimephales promelas]